ncbi:MAG: 3-phosphoserine/phosphohydroxythreonine transaminase [Deltaproteobacteria bacterium]|nr:3-phosphoserine/phosphohydroxythreonine transaminase [Deltaproteobacteria bacterium]
MTRVHNFNAGPAALPLEAIERAQKELVEIDGTGMSILEHSHREATYEKVHREAITLLREYLSIPDTHDVIFMQGGARMQFAFVPLNLLHAGKSADYLVTGTWAKQAHEEATLVAASYGAKARKVISTEVDKKFTRVPEPSEYTLDADAAYVHLTSNNTLFGSQWASYPDTGSVPLVCDTTSDLGSRAMDWSKVALAYAGAQKNLGPAGVTIVIARKDLVANGRTDIPGIFRYKAYAESESLLNTPPVFAIYMLRNTVRALLDWGGLSVVSKECDDKAALLYGVIDAKPDFWRAPVEKNSRSKMNVVFRLPTEELEKKFLSEATKAGLVGLKGHRSVGGVRASIYTAVRRSSVEALAKLMEGFAGS